MKKRLKYTLISDGPTDAILIPIINWTLKEAGGIELAEGVCAEFWRLPNPPDGLAERMLEAVDLYPCEVLFVHRDAEKDAPRIRSTEIRAALTTAQASGFRLPVVSVIPVRMVEAWLLFDELAIRHAAGNPNGKVKLNLPTLQNVESRPDPKRDLQQALQTASELRGRRLKKFHTRSAFWSVVDHLDDFTPLRRLPGFLGFEQAVRRIKDNQWQSQFYGLD